MATEFKLPELGENVDSADVVRVLIAPGDSVDKEQPVVEVESDKAALEVPSSVAGVVSEVLVKEGDKVKPGQVLFTVDANGAGKKPAPKKAKADKPEAKAPKKQEESKPAKSKADESKTTATGSAPAAPAPAGAEGPVFASPSVRQFAREIGVEIAQVTGSGPGGRISVDDVKKFAREAKGAGPATASPAAEGAPAAVKLPDFTRWGPVRREKMSNVRRTTVRHMALSWSQVPHVTLNNRADITAIEEMRQRLKGKAEAAGGKLTVTAILLKVLAAGLKAHPKLNASLDVAAGEVVFKDYVHIGVAADTDRGLVVPVVRDVDAKSIVQLAVELTELAEKARAGRLSPDQMAGGTFTLTNLGGVGVEHFTPIVNFPEVAILAVGTARRRLVESAGQFSPRLILPLSLSIDHRLVDGADGARFLQWVVDALQTPLFAEM
ncbi:MAG: Dihydrolipoyllysine-residue acetyltransferase component of pyruvate dehydrogenase complex [Phycisphaerae bacterium]|nr:Dihydrolipoyllysine-residue acetyltransferase component of pyruvate dehydrogenase complex [Phycisphaerae bacterium]